MSSHRSRYPEVSRRSLLKRSAGLGFVALVPGLACVKQDSDAFDGAAVTGSSATAAVATDDTTTTSATSTSPSTTAATQESAPATEPPPSSTTGAGSGALPAGEVLEIAFTYQQAQGGKNVPPYVAVWIEDADGELVDTVALWYEQTQKGPNWLKDLRRWNNVDEDRIAAGGADVVDIVSSATRLPGTYIVAWDGMTVDNEVAPPGDYFVCLESNRERGPYSLIREPVALTGEPTTMELPDDGELVAASAQTT